MLTLLSHLRGHLLNVLNRNNCRSLIDRVCLDKWYLSAKISTTTVNLNKRHKAINFFTKSDAFKFMPSMVSLGSIQDSPDQSNNTLVVMVGWLEAKERNLSKYVQLYHKRDIDVLQVKTRWIDWLSPKHILIPNSVKVAYGLNEICSIYPNIIFHTFSSGGYFYASVIDAIQNDPELAQLPKHLKGVIFDSLSDLTYVLSHKKALEEIMNPALIKLLPSTKLANLLNSKKECPAFLRFSPSKLDFFIQKNNIIKENPLKLPSLLLFSRIDPLSDMKANFKLADYWHKKGIDVMSQCWADAPHVQLFRRYPEEYEDWIDSFLSRVTSS